MKNFLEKKRGTPLRIIIDMNAQKQPTHYYEGVLIAVIEGVIILKDQHLGEVAINPEKITAIQMPQGQAVGSSAQEIELPTT